MIGPCRTLQSLRSWGSCKTFAMENLWSWLTSDEALEVEDDDDDEEMKVSHVSLLSNSDECSHPRECTTNVVEYEKDNPGAKYGMKTGKAVAKGSADTLKEILKNAKLIALKGTIAFAFIGSFHQCLLSKCGWASRESMHLCHQGLGSLCVGTGEAFRAGVCKRSAWWSLWRHLESYHWGISDQIVGLECNGIQELRTVAWFCELLVVFLDFCCISKRAVCWD